MVVLGATVIGSIVDKYEILEKIGEGGMATVYRGRHVTLGRDVAVKVLHPHLSSKERNRQRFAREAQAIERLDHDHILSILDYSGAEEKNCYIVTEYIDGVTLKELLEERGRFPSEIVAMMGIELISALGYAHQLGLVHRDLKPENVMLRKDGVIKLMDFGIARFMDESQLTVTGTLVGSPAYMSPEQALEKPVDSRSDLFSLGTLLYHLVTGQLPFSGSNPSIILRNIIENNFVSPDNINGDVSTPLVDLIDGLLQKEPEDRNLSVEYIMKTFHMVLEEADLDTSQHVWSIQTWMTDPAGYGDRLNEHLSQTLLQLGQGKMKAQDHIGAHKVFNRLLSIDEDNPEVVELITQMYQNEEKATAKATWPLFFLPLMATGALTFFFFAETPSETPTPLPVSAVESLEVSAVPLPATVEEKSVAVEVPSPSVSTSAEPDPIMKPVKKEVVESSAKRPLIKKKKPKKKAEPPIKTIKMPPLQPSSETPKKAVEKARLTVTVPDSWADIWIDGKKIGRTGRVGAISVEPGTHELKLVNDYAITYKQEFTVSPGELKNIEVTALQRKPATLLVSKNYSKECLAFLDGLSIGKLKNLGYKIKVSNPASEHVLKLECDEDVSVRKSVPQLNPGAMYPIQ